MNRFRLPQLNPPWGYVVVAVAWSAACSDPLADLRELRRFCRLYQRGTIDFGRAAEARMARQTFALLAAKLRDVVADQTVENINELLRVENLPRVVIDDSCRDWLVIVTGRHRDGTLSLDTTHLTVN